MADLVFYYGAMDCSKTAMALMTKYQYERRGLSVLLLKPATDTRDDIVHEDGSVTCVIKSRAGLWDNASVLEKDGSLMGMFFNGPPVDLVIIDEAQFLTESQVDEAKAIAEIVDIPVYCYGLRTDFKTKLFPGSARLFEICSEAIQLKAICDCGKPAIINARFCNGKLMTEGDQVDIGGDEKYKALCYSCWKKHSKRGGNV